MVGNVKWIICWSKRIQMCDVAVQLFPLRLKRFDLIEGKTHVRDMKVSIIELLELFVCVFLYLYNFIFFRDNINVNVQEFNLLLSFYFFWH